MSKKSEPKPKILKVVRADAFVLIRQETARTTEISTVPDPEKPGETVKKPVTNSREVEEKSHEAPLPAFDRALQALAPVAAKALGCPPDWREGINVTAIAVSYTEHGVRSAQILFTKPTLGGEALHPLKTPFFQIDDGKTADQGRRQCPPSHAEAVADFLKQAQRYAAGERSQQLLNWEEDEDEGDDDKTVPMPGIGDAGE